MVEFAQWKGKTRATDTIDKVIRDWVVQLVH